MQDVIFVAVMIAFFGVCVLFVRACDWLIGSEDLLRADVEVEPIETTETDEAVAA